MQLKEMESYFFGPLGREYCVYFYFLTVFAFVSFALAGVSSVYSMVTSKKFDIRGTLVSLLMLFLTYFQSRLLYSMCVM